MVVVGATVAAEDPSLSLGASNHQAARISTTSKARPSSRRTQYTRGGSGPEGRITVLTAQR
jgi:hypothetical protein